LHKSAWITYEVSDSGNNADIGWEFRDGEYIGFWWNNLGDVKGTSVESEIEVGELWITKLLFPFEKIIDGTMSSFIP